MFKNYTLQQIRDLNKDDNPPYVVYHQNLRSDHLIIYFGSHEGKFAGMTNVQSLQCNGLFIRSDRAKWYVQNYDKFGKCPVELSKKINDFLKLKKHIKTITIAGFSMGGYGALLFATWINANKVVATAPQTKFPDYVVAGTIPERYEGFPEYLFDINTTWSEYGTPSMEIILQCCERNCEKESFRDIDDTLRIKEKNPTVKTILLSCSGHKGITAALLNKKEEYEKMFLP